MPDGNAANATGQPPVRTFKQRHRALSPRRAELFERLEPRWCVAETGDRFDPLTEFGRSAPLVVDIGIGLGDSTTTMALADPGTDVIGCDVHTPGIASTLSRIEALGVSNLRLLHGDGLRFLDRLAPASLSGIRIYFPDPWPKARHRHRRMTSEANVACFVDLLAHGGTLHVATDIEDYAVQTQRICDAHPQLSGGVVERPDWRPFTRYERKGLDAGRPVFDLIYRRSDASERHELVATNAFEIGASAIGADAGRRVDDTGDLNLALEDG